MAIKLLFFLSDTEDKTSGPLNRRSIANLPLLRTLLAICHKSQQPSSWEVMESSFSSIWKFGSVKNPFAMITSPFELFFRFRTFFLLVQTKKKNSMDYGSSTSCWKPWSWVRFDLIHMMRDLYINSNLNPVTKYKDILPWKIS